MSSVTLTKPDVFGIQYIDTLGNVIIPAPVLDSLPVWTDTDATVVEMQEPANDATVTLTPLKAGNATVAVTVHVAGVAFTASLDVTVPVPVLFAIQIVQTA